MFGGGFARGLGQGVRRLAQSNSAAAPRATQRFVSAPVSLFKPVLQPSFLRPFSALGAGQAMPKAAPVVNKVLSAPAVVQDVAVQAKGLLTTCKTDNMVFEIGLSFTVLHYQSIFIGVMRCVFQAFRPLLILFVFGQILKAVFFIAGAPIWMSFYSIWIFEVGYGLAQCAISFIFISFFYNNLSFARIRPTLRHMIQQQRAKVARALSML
ncbi:unnamed protein product [Polarella glacialis]|uniref:Uncharacterized protein n=1 Tax=Polarella glacialis TaxID=89957 RepID=A0A813FRK2_POLGL|nr:unnamed protein product [Polarella glacialis]|eukprot:CAMPEP_0115088528 /NCGR_PEP_ID=MMETSP0227-20121206/24050_1 /TAXON_ID=89957 /ORGANISM="Polarella glacialis, Strain CCMP 1383" /LENGTH=209 /DNA_ID=CAMNT_0002478825 /DNA_START=67 /DNA_END=696 /DNA_ORIENTATION=+